MKLFRCCNICIIKTIRKWIMECISIQPEKKVQFLFSVKQMTDLTFIFIYPAVALPSDWFSFPQGEK